MGTDLLNSGDATREQIRNLLADIRQETFHAGYREGRIEARVSIITRMRKLDISWQVIEQITGLSKEDYRDLKGYWPAQIS